MSIFILFQFAQFIIPYHTVTSEKTGFETVDMTASRPVFAFSEKKATHLLGQMH